MASPQPISRRKGTAHHGCHIDRRLSAAGTRATRSDLAATRSTGRRGAPSNILDREIANEGPLLNQKQLEDAGRMNQTEAAELSKVLVPPFDLMNDTEGYGYPKGSRVYKINMQQALCSPS